VTGVVAGPAPGVLDRAGLYAGLGDPALASMNFLNEVAMRYPDAVSFAAGRPCEDYLDVDDVPRHLARYREYLRVERGYGPGEVNRVLLQYGRTKGIIHELVARNLEIDEDIRVDPEAVVVTVGCQEAMYLVLRALRATDRDALLAISPNYVGITGAARLVDMPVLPVRGGPAGIDLDDLVDALHRAAAAGYRVRALYLVPDFANPGGTTIDRPTRERLLDIAAGHGVLLLEDNPYGLFHAGGGRLPTLKALDRDRRTVVYLGSFAKTVMPGARVGYVVADQRVAGGTLFADELSKIKSMVTVNTSPIAQAVVAGKLLDHGCSLVRANAREAEIYRRNRRLLLDGLAARFPGGEVTWNTPAGGFFAVLTLPFPADDALLELSAQRYGVLWTPMHHFYAGNGGERQLRLSYSQLEPASIATGLDRLAALIADRLPTVEEVPR
jgi:(S)-3,5-dihydroxyphenylglycine transaminase